MEGRTSYYSPTLGITKLTQMRHNLRLGRWTSFTTEMMNDNKNRNWRDDYDNVPRSQEYDWLKDLNDVTKFHERNIGHDHLFRSEEIKPKYLKSPAKSLAREPIHDLDLNANITAVKITDGREKGKERTRARGEKSKLIELGSAVAKSKPNKFQLTRGRGRGIRREDQDTTTVGGGIPRMISNNLGTAHRLHQGERDVGGSGGSSTSKISSNDEMDRMWNPFEDQNENEDDDICREFHLKAKLDNQPGSYMSLWEGNGNKRC